MLLAEGSLASLGGFTALIAAAIAATTLCALALLVLLVREWRRGELW